MKHLVSVQDLSCLGRCSQTVALPVISAMGVRCSVLPTAVLSTHTAFPDPVVIPLTDGILPFANHWQGQNLHFDGFLVGYLGDEAQIQAVGELLDKFPAPVILDPAAGDHGRRYRRITPAYLEALKGLCCRAKVILPNVTEAAFLTGLPYTEAPGEAWLRAAGEKLLELGLESVVITGVPRGQEYLGLWGLDRAGTEFYRENPRIPRSFHGTGDLFAAVFAAGLARGLTSPQAAELGGAFVARCVAATPEVSAHGVAFETELPWLWGKLGEFWG